jgi:hypothetical protein
MKTKPKSQTPTDILNWCDVQEEDAKKTIDMLLDNHDWNDKKIKKALQVASQILTMVDKLKQTALDAIIK